MSRVSPKNSNLSIATHGSDGGIFQTLPISHSLGCLYSLIDRKRIPMPSVIDSGCRRPVSWINIANISQSGIALDVCSLGSFFRGSLNSPPSPTFVQGLPAKPHPGIHAAGSVLAVGGWAAGTDLTTTKIGRSINVIHLQHQLGP